MTKTILIGIHMMMKMTMKIWNLMKIRKNDDVRGLNLRGVFKFKMPYYTGTWWISVRSVPPPCPPTPHPPTLLVFESV